MKYQSIHHRYIVSSKKDNCVKFDSLNNLEILKLVTLLSTNEMHDCAYIK